ncbi:MAG: acetoacetyl-CoA reductase [Pseudomonadota bacterium]
MTTPSTKHHSPSTKRIALVSGGTRGIGAAISIALKNAGYKVAATYAARDDVAEAFSKEHHIAVFKWDIADYDACVEGMKKVSAKLGGHVDVLVNNAGITRDGAMHKMDGKQWNEVIDTNLNSCFYMSRAVIDSMREHKFGRIINISSMNGQLGQFGQTNYSAAKSGIFGFTKALARETASRGITVNAIAPGYIATDMVKAIKEDVMKKIIEGIPVGRLGEPEEVARAVVFLAANEAAFITGETISINGGQHME